MSATMSRRPADVAFVPISSWKMAPNVYWLVTLKHAERGDRLVDLHAGRCPAESALRLSAGDDAREPVDDRAIQCAHRPRFPELAPLRLVLGHHQPHETRMLQIVAIRELDDAAHRIDRRQVVEVELALRLADLRVHLLEHRDVELFLAAEVVVDERPRVCVRAAMASMLAPLKPRAANSSMAAATMLARFAAGALGLRIAALRAFSRPRPSPPGINDIAS